MNKYYEGVKKLTLPQYDGGKNLKIRALADIPFEIKRVFYIFGKDNVGTVRGKHSNKKSEFVLFNIRGCCKVKTIDEEGIEVVYALNKPNHAVYLPKMVWKEMYDFTEDCVLMVLTNEFYDENEYIRNFDDFVTAIKENR